jgi:hypothetical protein
MILETRHPPRCRRRKKPKHLLKRPKTVRTFTFSHLDPSDTRRFGRRTPVGPPLATRRTTRPTRRPMPERAAIQDAETKKVRQNAGLSGSGFANQRIRNRRTGSVPGPDWSEPGFAGSEAGPAGSCRVQPINPAPPPSAWRYRSAQ